MKFYSFEQGYATSLFPLIFESRTKIIRVLINSVRQFYLVGGKDPGGLNLLRPIIELSVISMASTGTQEFRDSIDLDEKLVRNSDNVDIANETLYVVQCACS